MHNRKTEIQEHIGKEVWAKENDKLYHGTLVEMVELIEDRLYDLEISTDNGEKIKVLNHRVYFDIDKAICAADDSCEYHHIMREEWRETTGKLEAERYERQSKI